MDWLALAAAALSCLVVGFVWYNPKVFGNAWMKSLGLNEEDLKKGNMALIFGLAFVLALLAAWFIDFMVSGHPPEDLNFGHGLFHGAMLGAVTVLPAMATNALFERRSFTYIAINVLYWIVCFALMGGILIVWK